MVKNKQIARRHHYLPRFYLSGFASQSEQIWVFDKTNVKFPIKSLPPKSVAFQRDLYSLLTIDPTESLFLEEELGNLENRTKLLFRKIDEQKELDNKEMRDLADYIALQLVRTPQMLANSKRLMEEIESLYFTEQLKAFMMNTNKLNEAVKEAMLQGVIPMSESVENAVSKLQQNASESAFCVKISEHKENYFTMALEQASALADQWLTESSFIILTAPVGGLGFFTSDHPLVSFAPYGGYAHPGTVLAFPTSKSRCILISHDNKCTFGYFSVDNTLVRSLNANHLIRSTRYVIGNNKEALERALSEYKI